MKEIITFLFGVSMLVNAALFIPQTLKILKTKSAKDVSILTFGGFNILQVIGVMYGYVQGDFTLMWGMVASLIACGSVTFCAIIFKNK
ncbi:MAG: PQ-loop domain-containing transporter [Bacteroidetes bacterium]|nr:PQ-loop domain-containing transporter [Bacteroidota bacterium]